MVATFTDDGVSASHNRPEARAGWSALLASPEPYDAVIIWKLDRLSRRVLDFHLANRALEERGAGLVAVENAIDMATPDGRLIAGVLAQFAEYEADAISSRVRAARKHLIRNGRLPGGTVPYGWRSTPNPGGPGYILAKDPDTIEYVQEAAARVSRGATIYSVVQWLGEVGAPLPRASQARRKSSGWSYTTVDRLIRNPILAGMIPFNPGNTTKARGDDVLRNEHGLPVVDESLAVMGVSEWRAMIERLENNDSPRAKPRALRSKTSALLSGLVWCGECDRRMHRGTTAGRESYSCPECHQTISRIEDYVIERFLEAKGDQVRWTVVEEVRVGDAGIVPEIDRRLDELEREIRAAATEEEMEAFEEQRKDLLRLRREKLAVQPRVELRYEEAGTFGEEWEGVAEDSVEARRAVLDDALDRVTIVRGRTGRGLDTNRLSFQWRDLDHLGPIPEPTDEELAAVANHNPVAPRRRRPGPPESED